MSDIIEAETGTALAVTPAAAISTIIAADKDDILGKLRAELAGYTPDASTEPGRKEIGQKTRRIGVAKMDFKRLKDGLLEDAKKQVTSVNAEYKVIETNCDALRDAIDGVLEAYKQIERDRVAGHEAALAEIERWSVFPGEWSSSMIADHYIACKEHPHQTRIWQEFAQKAQYTIDGSMNALDRLFGAKLKEETEAAELIRLRAEQAERQRLAAIEAQRVREERIATEAAEAARVAAEAKATRQAEAAAQAARDAQEAAERKAAAEVMEAEKQARQAREMAAAAQARVAQAEADKIEAAAAAERAREAAAVKAERDKAAAVAAEQKRAADAEAAEDAAAVKRAENVAHQRKINGEVLADIVTAMAEMHTGTSGEAAAIAKDIVKAMAKGEIRHCRVEY